MTQEEFIRRAREVHGERYDYNNVKYNGSHDKVEIICKEHGVFYQEPNSHLNGNGCPMCKWGWSKEKAKEEKKRREEEIHDFIERCKEKGKIIDDNWDIRYNNKEKITIVCNLKEDYQENNK